MIPISVSRIIFVTIIAGSAGALASTFFAWAIQWFITQEPGGKPSLSSIINGVLGGCVSITASCAYVSYGSAFYIGIVGGIIVTVSTFFFDWLEIDDPVGAIPVHLVCGIWGTLAVGLFSESRIYKILESSKIPVPDSDGVIFGGGWLQFGHQVKGIATVATLSLFASLIGWLLVGFFVTFLLNKFLKKKVRVSPSNGFGLRVPEEVELQGSSLFFLEYYDQKEKDSSKPETEN